MYTPLIDIDIPLADYAPSFQSLEERVHAAMATLTDLEADPQVTAEDRKISRKIFTEGVATDEELASPGVVVHIASLLNEYDKTVVHSAAQLRIYVTNRLIMESDNRDARIRMKALEMLGKISDVGLFTDKTEITMRHRPTEELEQLLRERLTRVIEGEVLEINPKRIEAHA
jgi:hypothetical protein